MRTNNLAPRIEYIKTIWYEGITAREIAEKLPRRLKCSRNAIIGMFNRHAERLAPMHLMVQKPSDGTKRKHTKKVKIVFESEPTPVKVSKQKLIDESKIGMMPLLELDNKQCHWITKMRPYLYCGCPVEKNLSYCTFHADIVYNPQARKPKDGQLTSNRSSAHTSAHE